MTDPTARPVGSDVAFGFVLGVVSMVVTALIMAGLLSVLFGRSG